MANGAVKQINTKPRKRVAGRRNGAASSHRRPKTGNSGPKRGRPNAGANARQRFEHYVSLAKEAERSGDAVGSENYYQHAEHYFRVMAETTAT